MPNVHVFGASGSGTSTLGEALAVQLGQRWVDTDESYWMPTDPPFTEKRPIPERILHLTAILDAPGHWVLSGALESWGGGLVPRLDAAIFLYIDAPLRHLRIVERERARFGDRIEPGGDMYAASQKFVEWSGHYESGEREGRSLPRHERFMAGLPCPLLRLEGEGTVQHHVDLVLSWLATAVPRTE